MRILEDFAQSLINSIMLLALGFAVYWLSPTLGKVAAEINPQVLGKQTTCDGLLLNYPNIYTETINGKKISFKYNCERSGFIASSYDGNCEGCSGRTRLTNEPVRWGICAVDTDIIPPKSSFYVPGYGPCKAADTGGLVKGRKIDLGFADVREGWWSKRPTLIYTYEN
ncbi:MAG: 3D domain-containing protein [Patescibacteria group bacterium]